MISGLLSVAVCGAFLCLVSAIPLSALSEIDSRLHADGGLSTRLILEQKTPTGALRVILSERIERRGPPVTAVGISSPLLDYGPLRLSGLVKEMGRPLGVGSMAGTSSIRLSLASSSLSGAVLRFADGRDQGLSLFGCSRGGLAPSGTRSGGAMIRLPSLGGFDLEAAGEVTLFGEESVSGEWFRDQPSAAAPTLLHLGGRMVWRGEASRLWLNGGLALTDRGLPAGFASGSVLYSEGGTLGTSTLPLSLALRLDGGLVEGRYLEVDGRYPLHVGFVRPLLSLRVCGLRLGATCSWRLDRPSGLPSVERGQNYGTRLTLDLDFDPLSVRCGVDARLDRGPDGRPILRRISLIGSRLSFGAISLESEIDLIDDNTEADAVRGGVTAELDGGSHNLALWARVNEEARLSGGLRAGLIRPLMAVDLSLRWVELGRVEAAGPWLVPVSSFRSLLSRTELSVACRARSR